MIRIKDVAEKTGYSITTVSKAFNDYQDISQVAKEAIIKAAKEMGYVPNAHARSLASKKSKTIGVIFDEALGYGLTHPYFSAVIDAFRQTVEEAGYELLFLSKKLGSDVETYYEHCLLRQVAGVFIPNVVYENEGIGTLLASKIPTVSIESDSLRCSVVNSDDFQGLHEGVHYLYGLGHRRIGHLASNIDDYAGGARLAGYLEAMKILGIEPIVIKGNQYSYESGLEASKDFLALAERPTAVTTSGDLMALGLMHGLMSAGLKVPEDVSIVGYDDLSFLKYMKPRLTTIKQDVIQIGRQAARLLLNHIHDPILPKREVWLQARLVIGETCRNIDN